MSSSTESNLSQQEKPSSIIIGGRSFHNTDSAYLLPNDIVENDRLNGQHFALKYLFEGNFNVKVLDYVSMDSETTKVLDCGCGPGTWIMDVAKDYPNCQLTGVDLSDVFPTNIQSSNIDFKVGNVVAGLPYDDNTFDFIHVRFLIAALREDEWPIVLKELFRILKPGGVIQSGECLVDENCRQFIQDITNRVMKFMQSRGQNPYICARIPSLLNDAQFEVIETVLKEVHLGQDDSISRAFLKDMINVYKSFQPFLAPQLNINTDAEYDEFLKRMAIEFQQEPQTVWGMTSTLARKPL
ncbi:S-adenosyl-L-methionine-dependent methyltransferase [Chlamydoabsidia padenii]|nr:S-adenosyl-L-methionine-dependent methyltransferase [Chlamydoabsidia padenii]